MTNQDFLPDIRVETTTWIDPKVNTFPWKVAHSTRMKRTIFSQVEVNVIELNFLGILEGRDLDAAVQELVQNWLQMRVLLSTRQELIDRGIRDHITTEAEELASNTNMALIDSSPMLTKMASMNTIQHLIGGQWKVDATNYHKIYSDTITLLNTWLASETEMSAIRNKHYYRIISKKPSIPKVEEVLE